MCCTFCTSPGGGTHVGTEGPTMSKRWSLICVTVIVAASAAITSPVSAAPPDDTSVLREAVTVDGITEHMAALEAIANANLFEGVPTRATGTPGHEASVDYVVEKMEAAGFDVSLQQFGANIFFEEGPAAFERVSPDPLTYPRFDGLNGVWFTAEFSGDGDATDR